MRDEELLSDLKERKPVLKTNQSLPIPEKQNSLSVVAAAQENGNRQGSAENKEEAKENENNMDRR